MKQIREQLVRYAKEKLNFKKSLRNTFFASAFLGVAFSSVLSGKAYAATTEESVILEHEESNSHKLSKSESQDSKIFTIGEKVYPVSGAKVYSDEYLLMNNKEAKSMRYPKEAKEISGLVFLVNEEPKVITNKDKISEYQAKYAFCGYLVNGVEGFMRAEDVFGLEETIEKITNSTKEESVLDEMPEMIEATPSEAATVSEATMATPAEVATKSEVKVATSSEVATASEISFYDQMKNIYRINDQVSIKPTAKFYNSLKRMNEGKNSKVYPNLDFNKVTGIVVNGKVYHENDTEQLKELLQSNMVVEGYEINHLRYLEADFVYQNDHLQITEEEIASRSTGIYSDAVKLTILPNANIYSSMVDMAFSKNAKSPLYPSGKVRETRGFVMRDKDNVFMVNDYEKAKEYLALGYEFCGYRLINNYSNQESNKVTYEGFFNKNNVIAYDEYLKQATASEVTMATPAEVSTKSEAKVATSSEVATASEMNMSTPSEVNILNRMNLNYITAKKAYLKALQESLIVKRSDNARKLIKNI
ncbi:MAG: hypothetical protein HFI09_05225 [Bacilli bacterium]|nr:hypothetical protein [Bacilli bacterium]